MTYIAQMERNNHIFIHSESNYAARRLFRFIHRFPLLTMSTITSLVFPGVSFHTGPVALHSRAFLHIRYRMFSFKQQSSQLSHLERPNELCNDHTDKSQ